MTIEKSVVLLEIKTRQPLSDEVNILELSTWVPDSPGSAAWLYIRTKDFSGNIHVTPAMKRELIKRLKGTEDE